MEDSTQVPGVSDALDESADKIETAAKPALPKGDKVRVMLRARFGAEVYDCWFHALEFESFDGRTVRASVPVKFLQNWIQAHYADGLLECCAAEFQGAERLEVVTREFGAGQRTRAGATGRSGSQRERGSGGAGRGRAPARGGRAKPGVHAAPHVNGFEGSPLDPKYTFESFVGGQGQPHRPRGGRPGGCDRARRAAAVQPALPPLPRRARQDASAACHRLGGEAARAQGAGALPDGRALPLSVRGGRAQPGCHRVQGQVPRHRHPADRRSRVHAGREDRAGVRAHHQRAARWRPPGRGGLGPSAGAARPPQRSHALAHAARPHRRDHRLRRGAAAQDPGAAGAGEAR